MLTIEQLKNITNKQAASIEYHMVGRDTHYIQDRLYKIKMLIWEWNSLTRPYVLRTDEEHLLCRKLSRAITKRLSKLDAKEGIHYKELSNGEKWLLY